ncbi:hypothetical protein [Streptosporangium canum]|uniref:hypothetical protein n=1 Tax=Streptosporangium canum TaxID=324952 RepID=UPI0037879D3D
MLPPKASRSNGVKTGVGEELDPAKLSSEATATAALLLLEDVVNDGALLGRADAEVACGGVERSLAEERLHPGGIGATLAQVSGAGEWRR